MYHSVVAEPTPNTHGLHQNHCPKQSDATLKTHMNTARGMGDNIRMCVRVKSMQNKRHKHKNQNTQHKNAYTHLSHWCT